MIQRLPYDEIFFDKNFTLKRLMKTFDVSNVSHILESDSTYPDEMNKKTCHFVFRKN